MVEQIRCIADDPGLRRDVLEQSSKRCEAELADFVECTRRGGQLHQDIDAVFLILDHTTNRFDLTDDTSKSVVELLFLVVGQHSWRLLDRLAFQEARF